MYWEQGKPKSDGKRYSGDWWIVNSWIIYKTNFPSSTITTQKLFRERLVEELIQPLLTLRADVTCPKHLQHSGKKNCFK